MTKEFVIVFGDKSEERHFAKDFPTLLQNIRRMENPRAPVEIFEVVTRQELIWRKEK